MTRYFGNVKALTLETELVEGKDMKIGPYRSRNHLSSVNLVAYKQNQNFTYDEYVFIELSNRNYPDVWRPRCYFRYVINCVNTAQVANNFYYYTSGQTDVIINQRNISCNTEFGNVTLYLHPESQDPPSSGINGTEHFITKSSGENQVVINIEFQSSARFEDGTTTKTLNNYHDHIHLLYESTDRIYYII
jgi:hypothetical protein